MKYFNLIRYLHSILELNEKQLGNETRVLLLNFTFNKKIYQSFFIYGNTDINNTITSYLAAKL